MIWVLVVSTYIHNIRNYVWSWLYYLSLSPTTAHEVRQRARCNNCGVKGNNTHQVVYTGNFDIAMDGAATLAEDSSEPI